jgi:Flp pilus assembly pilin Flp
MKNLLAGLYLSLRGLRRDERGQDLVEYALLFALISLTLISGINGIATSVNSVFNNISATLA